MRSRLAYTLSFWLLGAVALSVLAMGGLTAWNLREGFSAYLQARDLDRFGRFVTLVETRLASRPSDLSDPASAEPPDMRGLLRELAILEGVAESTRPPPDPWVAALHPGSLPWVAAPPLAVPDPWARRPAQQTPSVLAWP